MKFTALIDLLVTYGFVPLFVASIYVSYKNYYRLSAVVAVCIVPYLIFWMAQDIARGKAGSAALYVILVVAYLWWATKNIIDYFDMKELDKQQVDKDPPVW